jgi:arylsulfatase A-like enzyme
MRVRCSILLYFILLLALPARAPGRDLPNVLLITVDTFRHDRLGCAGYGRDITPNLDRIASEGVLFTQAISSSSWTTPGLMSVLTGLYAPTHGVDARDKSLRADAPTLPRLLRPLGYVSPDICYLTVIPNFSGLGFDAYARRDSLLTNGDEVLFQCLEDCREQRFFIYYHYRDLHLPYSPAPPYDRMFTPEGFDPARLPEAKRRAVMEDVMIPFGQVTFEEGDRGWINGLYDGEVRQMDERFFGRLEETLVRLGLKERTLLIVTADHGEELLDHGFVGHASTSLKGTSYDEVIRIPLILRYPGGLPAGRRVTEQVQNIDVAPTVLDLLGAEAPEALQGQSLLPLIRGEAGWQERPAFCETTPGGYQAPPEMLKTRVRAMRTPEWKFIRTAGPSVDEAELYHLKEDRGERRNVVAEYPDVARQMRGELEGWVEKAEGSPSIRPYGATRDERTAVAPSSGQRPRIEGQKAEIEESLNPKPETRNPKPVESILILSPAEGETLRFEAAQGTIAPRWTGDSTAAYAAEYSVGEGSHHLEGEIPVQGSAPRYGPFGETMWNTLALYNPWRFRVRRADDPKGWSAWRTFSVAPLGRAPSRSPAAGATGVLLRLGYGKAAAVGAGVAVLIGAGLPAYLFFRRRGRR